MSSPLQSFFMELLPHLQGGDRDRQMRISVSRPTTFFANADDIIMGNTPHMPASAGAAAREVSRGDGSSSNSVTGHVYDGDIPPILWIQREQQRIQSMPTNNSSDVNDAPVPESQRLRQQGNTAFNAGNYTEALRLYTEAIAADPTETVNYTNRSFTHFKMGEFTLSAKDAEKAIECSPQFYKAHYRLGLAHLARGEYTQALSSLRKAATFAPLNVKDEILVAIAKCESKVARTPATPLLTDNSFTQTQRSTFGSFAEGNTPNASDAARHATHYHHTTHRDSNGHMHTMYDGGGVGESGSCRESMGGGDSETGTSSETGSIPEFRAMTSLLDEVLSIREEVRDYHARYTQQDQIAECRHRAQNIRQLLNIANSGKLPQLTKAAEEAQAALRRTLKSENRSVYYDAKKTRDEALQKLWTTAHEMRAAITKLKTMAKEENVFLQLFLSPSTQELLPPSPTAQSAASATTPLLPKGRSETIEVNPSSFSLVRVTTPRQEEIATAATTEHGTAGGMLSDTDALHETADSHVTATKSRCTNSHSRVPSSASSLSQSTENPTSPVPVPEHDNTHASSHGNGNTDDSVHTMVAQNARREDSKRAGSLESTTPGAAFAPVEMTPADLQAIREGSVVSHTNSKEDNQYYNRNNTRDDASSSHSSYNNTNTTNDNEGNVHRCVSSTSPSTSTAAAAATTTANDAHFDQLLRRREEIDEHVRKAQRCCAVTDATGRAFLCALREEQRVVQLLGPFLTEAKSLNAGLEAHARSVAHSTYRELTAARLEALDTVRAHAERIQTDENAFCASAAEGDRLLETEAELERERLMYERQRIKVQAEVEWLKVRDMPEHRITALQNHVKILQQKASDINLRQREVQERILRVINADHPEIAWKSLALGSRIVSLVKGSGLWLNLSFSDFQILSTLSSTVNSKVYHAVRRGEHVALKEMPIDAESERRRFQREVDIVAGCTHPNIIRIKGVFFDGPFAYLLMSYYHRGSAKSLLTKRTPQPWIFYQDMFRQIATALAYLHERGIVHGDIKPSNVLLSDDGRPLISDFGIAKNYGRFGELADVTMTTTNHSSSAMATAAAGRGGATGSSAANTHAAVMSMTSRGTMNYMAPEQLRGEVATSSSANKDGPPHHEFSGGSFGGGATGLSDIWAFGVSMYELAASNAAAFDEAAGGGSSDKNHNAHGSGSSYEFVMPVITPEMRRVEVPARRVGGSAKLADLISSALVVDPARRSTAYELLAHPYFSTACNAREDSAEGGLGSDTLLRSDERLEAVRSYIHAVRRGQEQEQKVLVSVSRQKMVESLQEIFSRLSESSMLSPIMVVFQGEAGIDEGALTTEMLNLFYEQLVRNHGALRCANSCSGCSDTNNGNSSNNNGDHHRNNASEWSGDDNDGGGGSRGTYNFGTATYLPAEDGGVCRISESMFELTGKVLLKNIIENRPLPLRLNPAVVKYFCGVEPSMLDLEEYDTALCDNLKRLLLLSKEDLIVADLDFSHFSASFLAEQHDGQYTRDTAVNSDNVRTYVALRVLYDMTAKRAVALGAMKKGFYSIRSLTTHLKLLSPFDLLMLLCGVQHISAQMVVDALEFHSFPRSSNTPRFLREILLRITQNNLRRFLLLCTSSPALPASNAMKKIKVVRGADVLRLPVGHGCVSQLDLPDYNDKKILNDKLQVALAHVSDGFHVV